MEGQEIDPRVIARYILEYQKNQDNLIKYQLDSSPDMERLKINLLGLDYDEKLDAWVYHADGTRLRMCNEKGAYTIITFTENRVSKIVSLSNLKDDEIRKRCKLYILELLWLLAEQMDAFEIPSYEVCMNILHLVDDIVYSTAKKADGAGERDTIRKQFSHVESSEKVTQVQGWNKWFSFPFGGQK